MPTRGVDPNWLLANTRSDLRMFIGGWPAIGYFPTLMSPDGEFRPTVLPRPGVRVRALAPPDGELSYTGDGFPRAIPHSSFLDVLEPYGYEVRSYSGVFADNFLIFDREWVFFQDSTPKALGFNGAPVSVSFAFRIVQDRGIATKLAAAFDAIWSGSSEVLHLDAEAIAGTRESREIQVLAAQYWDELIRELAANPKPLTKMDWRRFEELIAELLSRDGFDVELTPRSGDGGTDVFARKPNEYGGQLYVVQCKRHAKTNPVKPSVVRELRTVVDDQRANKGVIVTTSSFTSGAREYAERFKYVLHLRDYESLNRWLRRLAVPGA